MHPTLVLGVDVGGTFTDVVVLGDGTRARGKVPSTPASPTDGVLAACDLVAAEMGLDRAALLPRLSRFGLGTTVITNVLATRSGRRLGLITTKGFEDLIPLARGSRVSVDGWLHPPPALVDRTRIVGVDERTDRNGRILAGVDPEDAVRAATYLRDVEAVDVIVVSFLWSFRNTVNEETAAAAIAARCADVPVVLGSRLAPVIREYDRTQFALLNAYVDGSLEWLATLADQLRADGLAPPLVLTHSSGGATTVAGARSIPIGLAQSGPAAGAAASTALADSLGEPEVVTCDLGGTSLDVALISGGAALRRTRGAILGHWTSMSMVDVDSVGSGGGSIAWVDPVGAIRVGPHSAGADPGPACYGRGGADATVTDALVVLGYIDPARFLDGRMPLDAPAAVHACTKVGAELGLDPVEAAWGIREVALATMSRAVRGRIAGRGLVASDLTLFAYGGCGGLFAADIAREVGARRAIVPALAPVFSAFGAATAPLRRERAKSVAVRLPANDDVLRSTFEQLRAGVLTDMVEDGIDPRDCRIDLEADIRFERQGAELTIPVTQGDGRSVDGHVLEDEFRTEYVRRFGPGAVAMGVAVEAMTLRAVATAPAGANGFRLPATGRTMPAPAGRRPVHQRRGEAAGAVSVYERNALETRVSFTGPAIIDAGDTTVWVGEDQIAHIDDLGSIVLEAGKP